MLFCKTSELFVHCLDKKTTAHITVVDLTVNNPRIDECHVQNIVKDVNWPSATCCLSGI